MKEFILTQSYATIEEMINSDEIAIYKEELKQSKINAYAIVSRIGNRYDFEGNKIDNFVFNPYYKEQETEVIEEISTTEEINEKMEETSMKYAEIEVLIDKEVENAIAELNAQHEQELERVRNEAKQEAKAEIIAKLGL